MKYLIVLLVVLVGVWLWRNNRRSEQRERQAGQSAAAPRSKLPPEPTEIVACAVCAVHLPRTDALPGGRGVYCSDAHRRQAEG